MGAEVSILMPVASPAPYVRETIQSVLSQTFTDWHLVVVLDGEAPEVEQALGSMVPPDRFTLVSLTERQGIAGALNAGIGVITTEFVARLDSDDNCDPERIGMQYAKLQTDPELALVGSSAKLIDSGGREIGVRLVTTGPGLSRSLLRRNQFVHSSVMFRRSKIQSVGGYDPNCDLREDYDLWLRVAGRYRIENLQAPLVEYRLSAAQSSRRVPAPVALNIIWRRQRELSRNLYSRRSQMMATVFWRVVWRYSQTRTGRAVKSTVEAVLQYAYPFGADRGGRQGRL